MHKSNLMERPQRAQRSKTSRLDISNLFNAVLWKFATFRFGFILSLIFSSFSCKFLMNADIDKINGTYMILTIDLDLTALAFKVAKRLTDVRCFPPPILNITVLA